MMSDIYVHILNLTELKFFCEHCKKHQNFTQLSGAEILHKRTVSADPWRIHPKICGNCPPKENFHNRKSEEIPTLHAVEATFAIIYMFFIQRRFKFFNKICLV